ncbi:hypothetical protein AMECASPLE_025446 [Ameca splendens]|uniref:Uncharacterized protein n=1 Tax=Ameca splendens TaxID=208324 RepID=A0ABV0XTJ7_9TELE
MSFSDVDHKKVRHVPEVSHELLELVKLEHKRGSGAAPKTQHQRSVVCRQEATQAEATERRTMQRRMDILTKKNAPFRYFNMLVLSPSMLITELMKLKQGR